jgi:hypothetical protein
MEKDEGVWAEKMKGNNEQKRVMEKRKRKEKWK